MQRQIDLNVWETILTQVANGSALSTVLNKNPDLPSYAWAKNQLRQNTDLQRRYVEACNDRADKMADDLVALAETPPPDHLDGPGRHAWVAQLKVIIAARQWTASKLKPKVYGDRLDVDVGQKQISITGALEAARTRMLNLDKEE